MFLAGEGVSDAGDSRVQPLQEVQRLASVAAPGQPNTKDGNERCKNAENYLHDGV